MKTLCELCKEINDWQDSVFTKATPLSAVTHLQREVIELTFAIQTKDWERGDIGMQQVREELADCFILLAGVAHLLEIDLEAAAEAKMIINRRRIWGEPDADGVVEHVKGTLLEVFKDDLRPDQISMLEEIISEE